ncbi:hypothetical protein V6U81_17820 [Micromonospora sp. CPCC 205711]|uniref:hypothetical protein n=1 Tax=Micromonospora sp. CPCC 205547 TaxID=3122400 RepID=UPI002FF36EF0
MTAFLCARCGVTLTPELTALPTVPEPPDESARDAETRRAASTVPRGRYAIEAEPWGAPYVPHEDPDAMVPCQPRGNIRIVDDACLISAGPRHTIVAHPEDVPDLHPLPGWENSSGCCGPAGTDGPNRACACGNRLATLTADCYTSYEMHLDPVRVHPVEVGVDG